MTSVAPYLVFFAGAAVVALTVGRTRALVLLARLLHTAPLQRSTGLPAACVAAAPPRSAHQR